MALGGVWKAPGGDQTPSGGSRQLLVGTKHLTVTEIYKIYTVHICASYVAFYNIPMALALTDPLCVLAWC